MVVRLATERGESTAAVLAAAIRRAAGRTRGSGAGAIQVRMMRVVLARAVQDLVRYEGAMLLLRDEVRGVLPPDRLLACAQIDAIDAAVCAALEANAALRRDMSAALAATSQARMSQRGGAR